METINYKGLTVRKETGDIKIVDEVLTKSGYRRKQIKFDVESGEKWLDLGANIGAFSKYCELRKVDRCISFEPDKDCFELLRINSNFICFDKAVTAIDAPTITFYQHRDVSNYSRGSVIPLTNFRSQVFVRNQFIGKIKIQFDGIKMDIEGSEFEILDKKLIPKCNKLVLEYHTSRDSSLPNLRSRLEYLKSIFKHVKYPPEYDKALESGETKFKSFFDRLIFCWN